MIVPKNSAEQARRRSGSDQSNDNQPGRSVDQQTLREIEDSIESIDDPDTKKVLELMYEELINE